MEIRGGPRSGLVRLRSLKSGDTFRKVHPETKQPSSETIYMKTQVSPEDKEGNGSRWKENDRVRCVSLRSGSWSFQSLEDEVLVVSGFFQVESEGGE